MKRREFITLLGARWRRGRSRRARSSRDAGDRLPRLLVRRANMRRFWPLSAPGLERRGFAEGRDVAIDYRWADGHYDRLPALAAELVRLPVAVLVVTGITAAAAAKAATATVPIVFDTGGDPVRFGLVGSLNRPGGNVTGVASLGKVLVAKRFELLRELVPGADAIAFRSIRAMRSPSRHQRRPGRGGRAGQKLIVVKAGNEADIDAAFAAIARQRGGGLLQRSTRSCKAGASSSWRWRRVTGFPRSMNGAISSPPAAW